MRSSHASRWRQGRVARDPSRRRCSSGRARRDRGERRGPEHPARDLGRRGRQLPGRGTDVGPTTPPGARRLVGPDAGNAASGRHLSERLDRLRLRHGARPARARPARAAALERLGRPVADSDGQAALVRNDGGPRALQAAERAAAARPVSSCVTIKYNGESAARVRLYGESQRNRAREVHRPARHARHAHRGRNGGSCSGFKADSTNYLGLGAGVIFTALLSTFPTYAAADEPTQAEREHWKNGEKHTYRFEVPVARHNAAQGLSVTSGFTWEARAGLAPRPRRARPPGSSCPQEPAGVARLDRARRPRACPRRAPLRPPLRPRGRGRSTQSACLITSRLCSITSTVLPASARRWSTSRSFSMSAKWRPGRRLVEDVERPAGRDLRELLRELDPLRLAARERRRGLAELHVVEPDVVQRLQPPADLRDLGEERERLLDRHREHVRDRLPLEAHLERLAVVARALAGLARDVDVREEVHLDLDRPVALARLAAAAAHVEREAAGLVAAHLRVLASASRARGSA